MNNPPLRTPFVASATSRCVSGCTLSGVLLQDAIPQVGALALGIFRGSVAYVAVSANLFWDTREINSCIHCRGCSPIQNQSYPISFNQQPVSDTQAGQATWINFTMSYALTPALHVGINGYFFKQLEDDRINGTSIADSREQVLGIGSGIFWQMSKTRAFWLNAYTETAVQNRSRNNLVLFAKIATSF